MSGFKTATNQGLRKAGLTDILTEVTLAGGHLVLTGRKGEQARVEAAEVTTLRFAEFPPTARTQGCCEAVIERPAGRLVFTAPRNDTAYAATMRGFAAAVQAARGPGAIRRGPGTGSAIVMMILTIGSLTLLLAVLLGFALLDGDWWWAAALLFAPLYLLAWRAQLRRNWPRSIGSLAELDSVLPPFTTGARA